MTELKVANNLEEMLMIDPGEIHRTLTDHFQNWYAAPL
eukprot:gene43396-57759_t